jgi:hypothetical protein
MELNGTRYAPFPGALDEIRLYDRALSAQEVRQLYESTMNISGVANGFEHFGVWCRNKTTGQEIKAGPQPRHVGLRGRRPDRLAGRRGVRRHQRHGLLRSR